MRVIWRFPLQPGEQIIHMPADPLLLTVGVQQPARTVTTVSLWAAIDPSRGTEARRFLVAPTGRPFDMDGWAYLGTVLIADGALVFHVFYEPATLAR